MPALAGIADRAGQDVCVMFFDINQLSKANEQYGHAYGDDVLKGVADSILSNVRTGDLVARWGGDEFVVAGLGSRPDAAALGARIEDAVRIAGVNLGRWPTTLKAGTAAGDPGQTTFDGLLAEAEAQAGNTPAISAGS
jgi:diguanylate cyclase (GGDEF)-like protein